MRRSQRFLVHPGLLTVMMLVLITAWSPAALAQAGGTPVPGTGTACGAAAMSLPGEVLPEGVVRELLLTTGIDSTAFASDEIPALSAVASVVCIAANTDVMVEVEGGPETADVTQDYPVTLVVLSGELELKLTKGCAGTTCTVTDGVATFRTATDYATPVAVGADWTPIPAGSTVALADVTISMRTTDSAVRMLSTGIAVDTIGGGACPSSCANWRNP